MFDALKKANEADWERYISHAFVTQLAKGALPRACFQHYLKQD